VNSKERYSLIKSSVEILFETSRPNDFVTFEDADDPDEYVQFKLVDSRLLAEVGSREWTDPTRPLTATAKEALGELGFNGGGPERNYANPDLPLAASPVAKVLHRAFEVAYVNRGIDLVVHTNSPELESWLREHDLWVVHPVAPAIVEPVTFEMVRTAMRGHGWRVFQDEATGGLMTYWGWDEDLGQSVHLHIDISGEAPWRVLALVAVGDRPVFDAERAQALEWVNEWNDEHRWPAASLCRQEGHEFSWVHVRWAIPVGAGACQAMVNDVTGVVASAALEFFQWFKDKRTGRLGQPEALMSPEAAA
jgi:hypothetical protein